MSAKRGPSQQGESGRTPSPHEWLGQDGSQRYVCLRCGVTRHGAWDDDNDPARTAETCEVSP